MEEALEWARRCPHPMPGEDAILEIRPLFEDEEFLTPKLLTQQKRLRAEINRTRKS